ncbi:MAG: PCMD domain-containing protein [Bacteroidaceae bacterium]|nr:PCMD domain-containing protein [Bacteroidaceae bacterium]
MLKNYFHKITLLLLTLSLSACIENDIPYPLVEVVVSGFEVEGQCQGPQGEAPVTINKKDRTITAYVDDQVNLAKLRITKMATAATDPEPTMDVVDSTRCNKYENFPRKPFASLDDLYMSSDTRVNFSDAKTPVRFRFHTYQDYFYDVTVKQVIIREISVENQVGDAVIDDQNHEVVIYVTPETNFSKVKVHKFNIGGTHGTVVPNPTDYEYYDFTKATKFFVKHGWEEASTEWQVVVYHKGGTPGPKTESEVYPHSVKAYVSGKTTVGSTIAIEYKEGSASDWTKLPASKIETTGQTFEATIDGLQPDKAYKYRIVTNGEAGNETDFKTAPAPALENGSFDVWHSEGDTKRALWCPWAEGGESFWDTGNHGATTVGASNSVPTDDTCNGKGQAAVLESKYIVIKFAAGNIFTGAYKQTDGTNGILDFGRPFTGFPSKMRVNYKYLCKTINKCGDDAYRHLLNEPDTAQIYIALTDWSAPFEIRTRPSTRQLFDPNDEHVIAYASLKLGDNVQQWTQKDLVLNYRSKKRTPKYILVVASASMYGDFFTGGEGSKLWVDNFELIYD